MPTVTLTPALRQEYDRLFNNCTIRPERIQEVERIAGLIATARTRYSAVADRLGIPWYFVGIVHNMESSLDFTRHLHNGDPLTARTVNVPAGRPTNGSPPFTWEVSATDALAMKSLGPNTDWSLSGILYQLERYNGFGYRLQHPNVLSPYLWSYSVHYTTGKYVADGTWSDTATSKQCGAAVILRRMAEKGIASFADQPPPTSGSPPLVVPYSMDKLGDPEQLRRAIELQKWLNTFPGVFVKVDGVPGEKTSDAFRQVTGKRLPGDPRG